MAHNKRRGGCGVGNYYICLSRNSQSPHSLAAAVDAAAAAVLCISLSLSSLPPSQSQISVAVGQVLSAARRPVIHLPFPLPPPESWRACARPAPVVLFRRPSVRSVRRLLSSSFLPSLLILLLSVCCNFWRVHNAAPTSQSSQSVSRSVFVRWRKTENRR